MVIEFRQTQRLDQASGSCVTRNDGPMWVQADRIDGDMQPLCRRPAHIVDHAITPLPVCNGPLSNPTPAVQPDHGERVFMSSRPEDSHLRALPDPYVNLSIHTAPDVRPFP